MIISSFVLKVVLLLEIITKLVVEPLRVECKIPVATPWLTVLPLLAVIFCELIVKVTSFSLPVAPLKILKGWLATSRLNCKTLPG